MPITFNDLSFRVFTSTFHSAAGIAFPTGVFRNEPTLYVSIK